MVKTDFKVAAIKLECSEAYLLKLEKNLSLGFKVNIVIKLCKNVVLNICRYLKHF